MKYFVYILESLVDQSYYIGVTNNLYRRLQEHNSGHSKYTKTKRPYKIVYSEGFYDIKEAYQKEKYLKSLKKRKYIEKLINNIRR